MSFTAQSGLKKVAGDLPGMSVGMGSNNNPIAAMQHAAMQQKTRFTTQNISYPLNVEGDSMQGHYIMFMVNEANNATLHADKINMTHRKVATKLRQEAQQRQIQQQKSANIPADSGNIGKYLESIKTFEKMKKSGIFGPGDMKMLDDLRKKVTELRSIHLLGGEAGPALMTDILGTTQIENLRLQDQVGGGSPTRSLSLKKHATTRLDTAISLYMPPSVSVSYGIKYAESEVGLIAETGARVINTILNNKDFSAEAISNTVSQFGADVGGGLWQGVKTAGIAALDVAAPGASTVIALERGAIITPRMEMMLEGVSRRSFNYTFVFIPKSAQEAKIVEDIIYAFKFHMHPEYFDGYGGTRKGMAKDEFGYGVPARMIAGVGREMTIPSTFDIAYMYRGKINSFLNKISTCFLTGMDVQYGGDRFTAYETTKGNFGDGPPPQKSQITLNFTEMEIITKERIIEGY